MLYRVILVKNFVMQLMIKTGCENLQYMSVNCDDGPMNPLTNWPATTGRPGWENCLQNQMNKLYI